MSKRSDERSTGAASGAAVGGSSELGRLPGSAELGSSAESAELGALSRSTRAGVATDAAADGVRGSTSLRVGRGAVLRADLALLAVAAVWGATFVMVKDALSFAGPFAFLAVRFGLATVLLAPLLLWAPRRAALDGSLLRAGVVLGVLLCAGYGFQTAGLQFTTPARAAFITGLNVVIVPLLIGLGLRRPVGRGVWVGVALATVGLALLSLGPELLSGSGRLVDPATLLGDLLVLGCAIVFAGHVFMAGEYAPRFDSFTLTLVQLASAALLALVLTLGFEHPRLEQLGPILPAAAFTGVFATVVAFTIQLRAQRFTSATHTALIFSTEPVFGALFAYLLAGEILAPVAILGCALILGGMLVAQLSD